jgi:hypothetical protein
MNELNAKCLEVVTDALLDTQYEPDDDRREKMRDYYRQHFAKVAIDAYEDYWADLGAHAQEGGKLPK